MFRHTIGLLLVGSLASSTSAHEAKSTWQEISEAVLARLERDGAKTDWPGKTAGIAVDPASGDVFLVIPGQGIWKSRDQGETFLRADDGEIGGRCETAYSLQFDPDGGRLACFLLDGKCGMTSDGGESWTAFAGLGRNWDYAAVDWSGERVTRIFGARHETGGQVYLSTDGGESWRELFVDPEFERSGGLGIFAGGELVHTMKGKGIQRSVDAGTTWTRVSDLEPRGRVVRVVRIAGADEATKKEIGYWIGTDGLLVSTDRGASWKRLGADVDASIGPFLDPRDSDHLAVAGVKGIFESNDGGESWERVAGLPEGFDLPKDGWYSNVAWDPGRGIYYASRMGRAAYKLETKRVSPANR